MGVDWSTVKTALHAWAMAGSGLADEKIVFVPAPRRPVSPYITIGVFSSSDVGIDYTSHQYNAGNDNLDIETGGLKRVVLQFQAFSSVGVGVGSGHDMLDGIKVNRHTETRHEALNTANIGVSNFGPIQAIGGVLGSQTWEPRAVMLANTLIPSVVTDSAEFIEFVKVSGVSAYWPPEQTIS